MGPVAGVRLGVDGAIVVAKGNISESICMCIYYIMYEIHWNSHWYLYNLHNSIFTHQHTGLGSSGVRSSSVAVLHSRVFVGDRHLYSLHTTYNPFVTSTS